MTRDRKAFVNILGQKLIYEDQIASRYRLFINTLRYRVSANNISINIESINIASINIESINIVSINIESINIFY